VDIYLAASYSRRLELLGYRKELEAAGHTVVSTWVDGHHEKPGQEAVDDGDGKRFNAPDEDVAGWASEDVADVLASDCIISFTGTGGRGGRHVEFGIGLGMKEMGQIEYPDMRLMIVGPREHVFHYLPGVEVYADWDECLAAL
jgi:hypothetical protein